MKYNVRVERNVLTLFIQSQKEWTTRMLSSQTSLKKLSLFCQNEIFLLSFIEKYNNLH